MSIASFIRAMYGISLRADDAFTAMVSTDLEFERAGYTLDERVRMYMGMAGLLVERQFAGDRRAAADHMLNCARKAREALE